MNNIHRYVIETTIFIQIILANVAVFYYMTKLYEDANIFSWIFLIVSSIVIAFSEIIILRTIE